MTPVAILCAAAAAALLTPFRPGSGRLPRAAGAWPFAVPMGRGVVLVGALAGTALTVLAQGRVLVLGLIVMASALSFARLRTRARDRKAADRREQRVVETCEVLVGELQAGHSPVLAIERCLEGWPALEPVVTAARLGADVPSAFRRLAEEPGCGGLSQVAGAWMLSQASGSGLAVSLSLVAVSAREAQSTRQVVAAELASAQATARLVAGLPLVTLLMGAGTGGNPWQFLLWTPLGLTCLSCGLALVVAGLAWMDRIASAVTAP